MEGNSNSKTNENNANDWRSQHEPNLRKIVVSSLVQWLKGVFTDLCINELKDFAIEIEEEAYGIAIDKDDYNQKVSERILMMQREAEDFHSGSSVNETHTLEPAVAAAQVMQRRQELLPQQQPLQQQMQRRQELLPQQQQMQGRQELLPQQQPLQQQMQGRQELLPHQQPLQQQLQQQMQGRQELLQQKHMFQHQVDHHGNLQPPHMQQLPHPTSFPSIQHPFARLSAVSGRNNSHFLPISQLSGLQGCASSQQKMDAHSQEQKQQAFTASCRRMAQQNMQQQPLSFHSDNVSAFPSEQQQNIPFGESGYNNFYVYGSSLLGTQGQELEQSQTMEHRSLEPHLLQASSGEEWQEETYQKIQALKEKHLPFLSSYLQRYVDKLQEVNSLPLEKQKEIHKEIQSLRNTKSSLQQATEFLNVDRNKISEMHRETLPKVEEKLLKMESLKPKQKKQGPSQRKIPPSLKKRLKMKSKDENNIMTSSGNVVLPSLKQNPQDMFLNPMQQHQRQFLPSQINQPALEYQIPQANVRHYLENYQMNSENLQQKHFHHWPMQKQQINSSLFQIPEANQHRDELSTWARIKMQQLQQPEATQQLRMATTSHQRNEMNDVRMRQWNNIEPCLLQHQLPTPLASQAQLLDQQILGASTFVTPSPETSFDIFPVLEDPEKTMYSFSHSHQFQTVAQSPPTDRMFREWQPSSQEVSESEMPFVISLDERIPGSFQSSEESRARRNLLMQEPRMKRSSTSQTKGYENFSSLETQGNSTQSSSFNMIEQEIKEINGRLIETSVEICNENDVTSETIVTCSYNPILCPNLKARYESGEIVKIKPLRLRIPENYPFSSPENIYLNSSEFALEDLDSRARSRFELCSRGLLEPISIKEIAQMWNDCARDTMVEYAARYGGGTFSSKYGVWETVRRDS